MEEQLVSLKVAQLLSLHGFCDNKSVTSPTQSLAQKWLRDTKGIVVIVDVDFTELKCYYCNIYDHSRLLAKQSSNYITYEEALEEGLEIALRLI